MASGAYQNILAESSVAFSSLLYESLMGLLETDTEVIKCLLKNV